jgi:FkbM family methyltransferase
MRLSGRFDTGPATFYDNVAPFAGWSRSTAFDVSWQPTPRLSQSIGYQRVDFRRADTRERVYDLDLVNTRTTFQFTKQFFFRAIAQYDSLRARVLTDLLASYELQPGTVAFVGYGSLYERRAYLDDEWVSGTGELPHHSTRVLPEGVVPVSVPKVLLMRDNASRGVNHAAHQTRSILGHQGVARIFRRLLAALFLAAVVLAALQLFEGGRAFTVRSYVRAERLWSRDFPIVRAKGFVRSFEPMLTRVGLLRPVRIEVEPHINLLLDPNDAIARTILVSRAGRWEPEVWRAISGGLSQGAVFFDVGAHIGYDTLKAAAAVGDTGRVVAFEPNPGTVAQLRSNVEASGARNIIVQAIACTDSDTTLTLFDSTPGGNSGATSLSRENAGPVTRSYTVRGRPIDDVVRELRLERLDVLKADVEGAELIVLRGATETLKKFHPKLILEVVPRQLSNMGTSVDELEAFVKSLGYTTSKTVDYKNKEYTVN